MAILFGAYFVPPQAEAPRIPDSVAGEVSRDLCHYHYDRSSLTQRPSLTRKGARGASYLLRT